MRGILVVPALLLVALAHAVLDEVEALRIEAQRLEEGGFATERAIREELGLVRPGQTLLRLPGDDVSSVRIP